ncbi:trypsin-like peptidase domain-containing protein [Marivita sp. S6314]|uniref:trypsin-like peptidase domain-containing protein n=1 Tax=Marivita sp. S6314 TaxID=2926406 RepID=UPI001FF63B4B|nr:trypsin-like peptidase domain-containing protein [Marivita sp. S6314]MCK0149764.1 trypsin-like peptidase domain-containing protein [Marivita sp. S6314]
MKTVQMIFSVVVAVGLWTQAASAQTQPRVPTSQAEISLSFAPLVKEAAPAVVNIYARQIVQSRSPFEGDPFFGNLFRDFGASRPRVQNSLGSGVIVSADGFVVSNYHVIGQADQIRVVLNDRREYEARVLIGDEESDLVILKIDAEDMPHLSLRDSDTVEVGELALAIGNPFGVGQTVSSGIVSGLARSGAVTGNARGYFLQTDAPINPGNSGGALIDVSGQLIGINTSILTRSGGSNGIGFAIPTALVEQFLEQARAGKTTFERPWAGATGQPVDAGLSDGLGLSRPEGVVLTALHRASPLAAAGLRVGDVVVSVAGHPVHSPAEMLFRMSVQGIGRDVDMTFLRDGALRDVRVSLMRPPDDPPRDTYVLSEREVLAGLEVARANPAVLDELGLPLTVDGIVVVDPGPLGRRVGLRTGDVLRRIDRALITAPRDVGPALRRAAPGIAIEAERGGQRLLLRFRT